MNCNCIEEVDRELKEKNLKLDCVELCFGLNVHVQLSLRTAWDDKALAPRGKKNSPTRILAAHCPFCGVSTKNEPALQTEEETV